MKKRILFVEQNQDGTIGGSHTALLALVRHMDRSGFEPIVGFYEPHAMLEDFQRVCPIVMLPAPHSFRIARASSAGLSDPIGLAALGVRKALNLGLWFAVSLARIVTVLRLRPDVIHTNNTVLTGIEWLIAARLCGAKLVAHQRGELAPPWYAARFDGVVCISREILASLKSRRSEFATSAVHIYDGLDMGAIRTRACETPVAHVRREFGVAEEDLLFGVVGNIKKWKGQDVLIRALPFLPKSIPWKCLVVGAVGNNEASIAYSERLRTLARELGFEDRVIFTGYRTDVPSIVNALDVLIHTSVMAEPFGLVIVEGMALGKPVICSAHGGPVEIVEEGISGFLVPPDDPSALAMRLGQLLSSRSYRERIGQAARARADVFGIATHVERVQSLYHSFWPV